MKNLIVVMATLMLSIGCQKQAREILRTDLSPADQAKAVTNFFPKQKDIPTHKPNEVVVRFRKGANKKLNRNYRKVEVPGMKSNAEPYYQVQVMDEQKALKELKKDPDLEYVGLNPSHQTQTIFVPNDPQYTAGQQWNLSAIEANKMWESGNVGRDDVYVVVLDEGSANWFCDYHGKTWVNAAEVNGITGVDDDNNGYVDDYYGWNWFNGSNVMYTGNNDHGHWCETMIGGKSGNGLGTASVLPNIKIISLKFLADFGYDTEAAKAVYYAIWLKQNKGLNIVAISNSWGGGGPTPILKEAIHEAGLADINFVCASGNSNLNTVTNPMYPASYDEPNILSVGASDQANNKAFFSNYTLPADSNNVTAVDIFAPGVNCLSAIPVNHAEGWAYYSGTSMSCPLVAAAIAAVACVNPEFTYQQRQDAVLNAAKEVTSLKPYVRRGRLLNLNNPVFFGNTTTVVPDVTCGVAPSLDVTPPTTMTLILDSIVEDHVTGHAAFYLRWTPPTDANSINGLIFNISANWTWFLEGNAWTGYVFVLPMDRLYQISGRAVDSWGNVANPSNVITKDYSGTPPPLDNIPPSIPQNLRSDQIQRTSFRLLWSASTDAGGSGLKDYKIHWRPKGRSLWSMTYTGTATTSYTVNSFVEPETTYECMVLAHDNANNHSDTSAIIEVTTIGDEPPAPDTQAPTLNGSPVASDITASSIKISYPSASDNVSVTGYTINWRVSGGSWLQQNVPGTTFTFNNLSQTTTYEFNYVARDAAGNTSLESNTISATTLTPPPSCPISSTLDAVSQSLNVTLNWTMDITGTCTVSSTRLERKKGGNGTYTVVAFNPNSPYTDNVPNPGNYTYRLQVQSSTGQTFYSNEKNIKVNKK